MPRTKARCTTAYTATSGSRIRIEAAIRTGHLATYWPCIHTRPRVRVAMLVALDHQQRPQEVVPHVDPGEHREHHHRRPDVRQQNSPVDLPRRAAVENGRLLEIGREGAEELPHQVGAERAAEQPRHDHRPRGIGPAEGAHQDELRDHGDRQRHHQRGQVQHEQRVAAPEWQPGEGISGQRAEEHLAGGDAAGVEHGVEEHPPERHQREHRRRSWTTADATATALG